MQSKNIELKPCPFCGGEAEEQWGPYPLKAPKVLFYHWCKKCGASTFPQYETVEEAIKAWNTRRGGNDDQKH